MPKGKIIFLNGVSSSGKSSIAKVLQAAIERPCIHHCIDDYLGAFQKGLWEKKTVIQQEWPHIIRGFHAAGAAIARAVLEENPPWVESLVELFDGIEVTFVGVHCPLEELERREQGRKDRKAGLARLQYAQVHAQAIYDIEVDTYELSPEACATKIIDYMRASDHTSAFKRLRDRIVGDSS
jgi:chloramphenicol 3-O phosphotransferase